MKCERCGETYNKRDAGATKDFCGTCIFIHGPTPDDNLLHKKVAQSLIITEQKKSRS